MRHIDIYMLLRFHRKKLDLSDKTIAFHLSEKLGKPVFPEDLERFMYSPPPSVKYVVHALADFGYPQKVIQEMTGLSQSTVSYHLHAQPDKEYINIYWKSVVEQR